MINKFLNFEENSGLLMDEIDGFHYWFFVRDKLYNKIIGLMKEDTSASHDTIYSKIDKMVGSDDLSSTKSIINISTISHIIQNIIFPKYLCANHKNILIFTSPRRVEQNGKYTSIYTDYICDSFLDSCVTAEFPNGLSHLRPAYSNPIIELDRVDIIPFVKGEVAKRVFKHKKNIFIKKGEWIASLINRNIAEVVDAASITSMIETRYYWYKYKRPILKGIIKKIDPKVIVEIGGYGRNNLIVNEVSNELGIPTVELQHGIIGSGHIAYNYKIDRRYCNLPKYLCVFSQYWKDTCNFPIGINNIIVTGFPYFETERNKHSKIKNSTIVNILLLSQPVCSTELINYCLELLKILPADCYHIHYKLHPLEYNHKLDIVEKFKEFNNITIYAGDSLSLYDLFALCTIQIGAFSTSIYEGLGFGLGTFILKTGNSEERVKDLISNNYVIPVSNANDTVEYLQSSVFTESKRVDPEYFFKSNAKNNVIDFLQRFI